MRSPLAIGTAALLATATTHAATCKRTVTALTSSCDSVCFTGRPCVAFAAGTACVNGTNGVCTTSSASGCSYSCLYYGPNDYVQRNIIEYSTFTFLLPFGTYKSEKEGNWSATAKRAVSSAVLPNQTTSFPAIGNDIVATVEPLSFMSFTKNVRIAGGTSLDGVQGRVAKMDLATQVLLNDTSLQSITLANLDLEQIPASSLPSQLVNVSLTNCILTTIPNDLYTMQNLTWLDMSKNYFTSVPTKLNLTALTFLNLSTNSIASFDAPLMALSTLDLSNNLLTGVPEVVYSMSGLTYLDLRSNSFSGVQLSQEQANFLSKVATLYVESWGTASCTTTSQKTIGGAPVCVKGFVNPVDGDTTKKSSNGGSNTGAIIGGIVGAILVLGLIAAIVIFFLRRTRKKNDKLSHTLTPGNLNGSTQSGMSSESINSLWTDQLLMSLKLNSDDIHDIRKIGTGAFNVVYLVQYRQTRFAASKRLKKDEFSWQNTQLFIAEVKLVHNLEHPRIVPLIGVAWTIESDFQALFEFMENGDLRTYVEAPSTPKQWTREKLQIAIDVIEALVYVHSFTPPLVHRDLKSRNILLDKENRAKLSDFGIARFRSDQATMTAGVGTGRWLAPEVISGSNDYDQSTDIFAFGVVMSELDTHELPYEDIRGPSGNRLADVALLQMVSVGKLVPTFSRSCPPEILKLASRCMAFERRARPTAVEVAYALRTIMRSNNYTPV